MAIAAASATAVGTNPSSTAGASSSSAKAAASALGHRLIPAQRGPLATHNATQYSTNWSGYAVTGRGITDVRSTFVVPAVKAAPAGFASTWAGIGGYGTSDLIQAGIAEESGGNYYAWYEILPASVTPIANCNGDASCSVRPGDRTYVHIYLKSRNLWTVLIVNDGHGVRWGWVSDVRYASSQSSAEWILEAPTLGTAGVGAQTLLANVGTVRFGPSSTFKVGRTQRTIAQGRPVRIVLSPGLANEATPSLLARNGQSFNDCAYQQTCAAP
jgi:hypothetical protein